MPVDEQRENVEKIVILGAGPAGLSAALYAARADLDPLVLIGSSLGGQASLTNAIENYPGFPDGIGGGELGELFQKQAERFGARFEFDIAKSVDFSTRPYKIHTYGREILAENVLIATGASPVHLNVPGEQLLTGRGVSYCGTCDGWFFRGKNVAVIGGGDSALEEGIFLTRFAETVTIIHRRDSLRAGAILQKRAFENPKINFIWDTVVESINGDDKVESITVKNVQTGKVNEIPFDGVFVFIGHSPNTEVLGGQIELDDHGYVQVDRHYRTNIPGVYAAGEICDPHYKQVVVSAGMGAAAAIEVQKSFG